MNHFSQQLLVNDRIGEFRASAARERMARGAQARRRARHPGPRAVLAGLAAALHR